MPAPAAKKSFIGRRPFAVLLVSLLLMLLLLPLLTLIGQWNAKLAGIPSLVPLSLIVISASAVALWEHVPHHAWHMGLTGVVIIGLAVGTTITHHASLTLQLVVQIVFLGNILRIVTLDVLMAKNVTKDILCGAVCVYLLTGIVAGLVLVLLELCIPGSFLIVPGATSAEGKEADLLLHPGWLLYFSFITLTTVGYGDVLPNNQVARSAAVFVALLGQVIMVVLIARLVGVHVAQSPGDRGKN